MLLTEDTYQGLPVFNDDELVSKEEWMADIPQMVEQIIKELEEAGEWQD